MFRWKPGWKTLVGATALVAVGCASGPPPRELLDARSAYQEPCPPAPRARGASRRSVARGPRGAAGGRARD
ncbi:hypothetical protein ACLESO_50415, partial [Pyxidicoccus sp. 3LG]